MADQYEGFDYEEASRNSNAAIAALIKQRKEKEAALLNGEAADFMSDPENLSYPIIEINSPETTSSTYTIDTTKRNSSGLNDSGLREDAPSGATREPTTGKGAFHLVTPAIGEVIDINGFIESYDADETDTTENALAMAIKDAYRWLATENIQYLDWAIDNIILACSCESKSHGFSNALMRLARHYENGAAKYDPRNWEKGLSSARCFDSGIRHMVRYIDGDRSEDHLAAAIWNLVGIKHYLMFGYYDTIEGVNDLVMPWRGTVKGEE